MQKDILLEIGNIGVGNSINSLSKIMNELVDLRLPDLKIIEKDEFVNNYGISSIIINSKIIGDLSGNLSFIFSKEEALKFIEIMTMVPIGSIKEINSMGQSALIELTNIICGSYLSAMSDFSQLELLPKPPEIMKFTDNSRISEFIGDNKGIELNTEFKIFNESLSSKMVLMINEKYMNMIIEIANEKLIEYSFKK